MTLDEVATTIRSYLAETFPNEGTDLTNTTDLLAEWFVDSVAIVETVLFLERSFGVRMGRADINGATFRNVESLATLVCSRL